MCQEELIALKKLGTSDSVPDDAVHQFEAFICRVYQAYASTTSLAEMRRSVFIANQILGDTLPPTSGYLTPAIKRANFKALVCGQGMTDQIQSSQSSWTRVVFGGGNIYLSHV